ncbi:MAG: DUF2341 domain-containing protein, partial [Candidatus Hodarchaeales archaeon]
IKLDHEIELFDQSGNGTHAQLIAWVRVPSLSGSTDTNITMYYGNNVVKNQENPTGVWDDNYLGVWHLSEDPPSTIYDSASDNSGTSTGSMTSADQVDGMIDGSLEFDGTDDSIVWTTAITQSTGTYSFWMFPHNVTGEFNFLADSNNVRRISLYNGGIRIETDTNSEYFDFTSSSIPINSWTQIVFVRSGDIGDLYINGSWIQQVTVTGADTLTVSAIAGIGSSRFFDGLMDEVHILSTTRSVEWIATEYNNQNDTNSFYSVSSEEEYSRWWADASFTKRKDIVIDKDKVGLFNYQKTITIDSTKVSGSGTLTDFPVLINFTDTDLADTSKVQADGDDISFTDSLGNTLDHELELFDQTYNSTHAELVAWVRIPSLSATSDTDIIMRYGNDNIGSQENPEGVWDSYYAGIWHLNEDPSGTSPQMLDSTINNNDGTSYGSMTSNDQVTGKIGGSLDFDESNDYINSGDIADITDEITIECWVQLPSQRPVHTHPDIVGKDGQYKIYHDGDNDGYITFSVKTDLSQKWPGKTGNPINTWIHVVGTYDGSNALIYINGVEQTSQALTGTIVQTTNPLRFGADPSNYFGGLVDEIRISNITRSAEWILTEYNNQNNPSSFISVGSEEIPADITNFPLLVNITHDDFKTGYLQPDADDLLFIDSSGTKLDHEIEEFSQNTRGGGLLAWVKVPTLSTSEDTVISMYYGNTELEAQENPEGVWNDNYVGIWHLDESGGDAVDSTSYGSDGILSAGVIQGASGQIDDAYEYDGNSDKVTIGDPIDGHLDFGTGSFTISFWLNIDASTTNYQIPIFKDGNTVDDAGYAFEINTAGTALDMHISDGTYHFTSSQIPVSFDTWMYVTGIVDRSQNLIQIYKDGSEVGSGTDISSLEDSLSNSVDLLISHDLYTPDGLIDEVHIADILRNSDWIATEYNNQYDPTSFIAVGSEIIFDNIAPVIEDFGIDDPGTGTGKFWAIVSDITSDVTSVKISINDSEYSMTNNNTHWIYQHSGVEWQKTYEYLITNASDSLDNYIETNSSVKYYTFTYDALAPDVLEWKYKTSTNTFRANVSDSWGELDTVIVNITSHSAALPDPPTQIMSFYQDFGVDGLGYINDTMAMS